MLHGGLIAKMCQTLATPFTVARYAPLSMGFPSKNTGVGCHFFLQGIFPTQRSNQSLLRLLHLASGFFVSELPGNPCTGLGPFVNIISFSASWQCCEVGNILFFTLEETGAQIM